MPRPVVHDPRQNHHGWWGTFILVDDDEANQKDFGLQVGFDDPECLLVFLKTNRDSHFIAQGTAIASVLFLSNDQSEAMKKLREINSTEGLGLTKEMLESMDSDLESLSGRKAQYYIINGVDYKNSAALARVHSLTTEACFNNDHWLDTAGDIGKGDIKLGRTLKRLPSKDAVSLPSAN